MRKKHTETYGKNTKNGNGEKQQIENKKDQQIYNIIKTH